MKDFKLINASQQQPYKSRFTTEKKEDEYPTAIPTPKRWSDRNPTVEPLWTRPKTEHWAPNQLNWKFLGRSLHWDWGPIRRRAIKEGTKDVNRDWVNHEACSLSHNIHVVVGYFITNDYFSQLIHSGQQFFYIYTLCHHKIWVTTGLVLVGFKDFV